MTEGTRIGELQRFAASRSSRRSFRASVVRALAPEVPPGDVLIEMAASRPGTRCTVVLVTTTRLLVGHQPGPSDPVVVTTFALSEVTEVATSETRPGALRIVAGVEQVHLEGFAPHEADQLAASIRERLSRPRRAARIRAGRRALSELEMLDVLHATGVLTVDELGTLRTRWLQRLAASPSSGSDAVASVVPGRAPA